MSFEDKYSLNDKVTIVEILDYKHQEITINRDLWVLYKFITCGQWSQNLSHQFLFLEKKVRGLVESDLKSYNSKYIGNPHYHALWKTEKY